MYRSNLKNLVRDAFLHGEASASDGRWKAWHHVGDGVVVWHYRAHMITVTRRGDVIGVERGWGSATDRAGVRRVTSGWGCNGGDGVGYRELFDA